MENALYGSISMPFYVLFADGAIGDDCSTGGDGDCLPAGEVCGTGGTNVCECDTGNSYLIGPEQSNACFLGMINSFK